MRRTEIVAERKNKKQPDVPRAAYTIPEFCSAHRISVSMYYKIRAEGLGPREARALSKVFISLESAQAWRKRMEAAAEQPDAAD